MDTFRLTAGELRNCVKDLDEDSDNRDSIQLVRLPKRIRDGGIGISIVDFRIESLEPGKTEQEHEVFLDGIESGKFDNMKDGEERVERNPGPLRR